MSVLKYGWFILHENAAFGSLHNVRGVSREWVRNSGVDGRPSRATVRFSVVGAIRRRFAFPAGHVFGTERKKPRSSPRRTSCTFRLKRRRCAVSSARPTTVMLRGWGAGCEARAGKGASNRERRPVKLGDLRRGRPSWGPASLMRPAEDRARRNVRVLCRYVADRTEDATVIAAL